MAARIGRCRPVGWSWAWDPRPLSDRPGVPWTTTTNCARGWLRFGLPPSRGGCGGTCSATATRAAVNVRGARWNPPGTTALYTGCTWDAAVAEGDHLVAMQPFRPTARRWVYSFDVKLARVLDLTDMALLADLGVGFPTLSGIDMTHCQRIGGAVAARGHEGLLVPSARIAPPTSCSTSPTSAPTPR